jgi:hypothetical protein
MESERIEGEMTVGKKKEHLIKWVCYDDDERTREPLENLENAQSVLLDWTAIHRRNSLKYYPFGVKGNPLHLYMLIRSIYYFASLLYRNPQSVVSLMLISDQIINCLHIFVLLVNAERMSSY